MNVTFKFRNTTASTPQFLYLVIRFGRNDKLLYNTKLKVAPKYWNFERMRVRAMVEVPEREYINSRLAAFSAALNEFYLENKIKGREVGKEDLRLFLDRFTGKKEKLTGSDLHDFIKDYLRKNEERINERTGVGISYRTKRKHIQLYSDLQEFERLHRGGRFLDFQDITLDFYRDFQCFCKQTERQKTR